MSNKQLKEEMKENREAFVDKLMSVLKEDPDATDSDKEYRNTREYLSELIDKDGSILNGLIIAMEMYLNK